MASKCPLCYCESYYVIYEHLLKRSCISIVKCRDCLHAYTLADYVVESSELYNDSIYKVVENRKTIFDKILNWEYKRVRKRITMLKPSKGSLLDFGSGKGKLASLAKQNGWNVNCVETAVERALYAKKVYGLEVNTDFYSTGRIFDSVFDVLTLFHVLEHLQSPASLLHELIRYNLKKDALIVIEVPNINSWQARIAGRHWMHWDIPRHLSHFSPARLEQFTASLGLTTLRTGYFSFHLGVLGMTDSILKKLGYRNNIIYELKNRKNKLIIFAIVFLLPLSFLAETIASLAGSGGVVRKYLIRKF